GLQEPASPGRYGITDKAMAIRRNHILLRAALTIGAAAAAAAAAPAQDQSSVQGPISIPEDVTIFENITPNVRRATAVVNGDIITGTDVEQRLALILAANEGRI